MKRKLICFLVVIHSLLFSCNWVLAQKQNATPSTKETVTRMSKQLGLNETQKSKVEEILNREKESVEAVFNEERKKLESIQQQTRLGLEEILTPEQMQKLEKHMRQKNKQPAAKNSK